MRHNNILLLILLFIAFTLLSNPLLQLTSSENLHTGLNIFVTAIIIIVGAILLILSIAQINELWKKYHKDTKIFRGKATSDSRLISNISTYDPSSSTNFARATLILKDGKRFKYAAGSKINNLEPEQEDQLKNEYNGIICSSTKLVDKHLRVKRLNPDLSWGRYWKLGFAEARKCCCERKICARILSDFTDAQLKDSTLELYTEMEPCIYCFQALTEMQEKGVRFKLLFGQMGYEIDYLTNNSDQELIKLLRNVQRK
ncbi:hypothetical protein [Paenibacillus sp. GCM10028914]|uniref:hypothetical protein n=1 Tax=Paenibacillus sp. GCM10028914 TaxID=3273416 RepID=UPI0036245C40